MVININKNIACIIVLLFIGALMDSVKSDN